jgi:hypothetical protein
VYRYAAPPPPPRVVEIDVSGVDLPGPVPPELGRLSALEQLYLEDNELTGDVPMVIPRSLASLEDLRLDNNQLTTSVPAVLVQRLCARGAPIHVESS